VTNWISPGLIDNAFGWAAFMTGIAFFWVGALKGRFVSHHWFFSGLETVFVGGIAASMAFWVGAILKDLVG
jgi:VIT1/CCC1 family predicted Fe2+/Mn2+ transporter